MASSVGELLGRDSNHASFGSEPKILPLDDRGMSCDGWGRTSVDRVTAGRPAIWTTSHRESPRVDSNHDWSGSEPDASAMLGYEGMKSPRSGSNRQPSAYKAAALPS